MAQLLLRGELLGDFDGVLFDKDGTLSHSEPRLLEQGHSRIQAAVNCFLEERKASNEGGEVQMQALRDLLFQAYGLSPSGVSPEGLLAVASRQHNLVATATVFSLVGLSWPKALLLAERSFKNAAQTRRRTGHRAGTEEPPSPLLPAARTALEQLHQLGVTCAVISNDTREGIKGFLRSHQLDDCMADIWSADDQPSKPDPDAVHQLCQRLGIPPQRCVLIGDADSDLLMARQAGIGLTLGYVAGWSSSPNLTEHERLISHWEDLEVVAS